MRYAILNLVRTRGDEITQEFQINLTDSNGDLIDVNTVTNWKLTVDTLKSPPDNTTNLVEIDGLAVGTDRVRFSGGWETLPAGKLYYDVQGDYSAERFTSVHGQLNITQDKTKD